MGTTTIQPIDASAGVPQYSAQNERQGFAAMMGGGSGRQLGARPGLRLGTPSNLITVTSTTWTAATEFAAILDPAYSTTQGPYRYSYSPSPSADSGSVTPADPALPRKDIIVIRVDDASAGDPSGARQAPLVYRAGVAASTPSAPTLNSREFLVGTISMPQVGAGSPTFTLNPQFFAAAGAKLPIYSPTDRAALTPYVGMEIQRMDLTQVSPAGVKEVWNGSTWDHFGHSEWTFNQTNPGFTSGIQFGPGALANDAAKTTDTSFVTTSGETLVVRDAGVYAVTLNGAWSHPSTGRCFSQITESTSSAVFRSGGSVNEDNLSVTVGNVRLGAGGVLTPATYVIFATGSNTWTGRIRVTRTA